LKFSRPEKLQLSIQHAFKWLNIPTCALDFCIQKSPVQLREYENNPLLSFDISGTSLLVLNVFIVVFSVLDKIAEFGSKLQRVKTIGKTSRMMAYGL